MSEPSRTDLGAGLEVSEFPMETRGLQKVGRFGRFAGRFEDDSLGVTRPGQAFLIGDDSFEGLEEILGAFLFGPNGR